MKQTSRAILAILLSIISSAVVCATPPAVNPAAKGASKSAVNAKPVPPPEEVVDLSAYKIESFNAGNFGEVIVFNADKVNPANLTLVLAGDGEWDAHFKRMMKNYATVDSMFVIVRTITFLKNITKSKVKCLYPAADLETLSHMIQKKYNFKNYVIPTLIGYSSGATLAYAVLAQSPENTFRGVIALGFCSDLEVITKPLCGGEGKLTSTYLKKTKSYDLTPNHNLKYPWYVINGTADTVCNFEHHKKYTEGLPNTHLIPIEGAGHGFLDADKWVPQYKSAFAALTPSVKVKPLDSSVKDLPLIEEPVEKSNDTLVVIVSGDGGWASIDKNLANVFNKNGYSVVGIDALKYFWSEKDPDIFGKDLERIATRYLKAWKKKKILWVGYSMGADVLPFGVTRLPDDLKEKTAGLVYLGLSDTAAFEFHFTNWLGVDDGEDALPIKPEIEKLSGLKNICIRGTSENDSGCDQLKSPVQTIKVPGGHHFNGDYDGVTMRILQAIH